MDPTDEAVRYITMCCPHVGDASGTTDVSRFLGQVASQIAASPDSVLFGYRYREHVAYALDMVACNPFTSSPAAVASVYLATRFEFYFRLLSGKLKPDGTWIDQQAQSAVKAALSDCRLDKRRVSSVALAYKIMKVDQSLAISQRCAELDRTLYPTPVTVVGDVKISDIGDRIEFHRNAAGHGQWGDISSDAIFYGLMTALVFYNQQTPGVAD